MSDDEKSQNNGDNVETNADDEVQVENPFDMDAGMDFGAAEKRRQRAIRKQKQKEAEQGFVMDGDVQVRKIGSLFDDDPLPPPRPNRKSISAGDADIDQEDKGATAEEMLQTMNEMNDRDRERNTVRVGDKVITKWPYDDYHTVQKEYWEHALEREEQAKLKRQQRQDGSESDSSVSVSSSEGEDDEDFSLSGSDSSESSSSSDSSRSETSAERLERKEAARRERKRLERKARRKAEKKRSKRLNRDTEKEQERRRKLRQKALEEERAAGLHDLKSDIMVFVRPQDPPEIKQAVAGLPLTEFESVAKERAIAVASTWLFDAGLVQELMQTKKVNDKEEDMLENGKKKKVEIKILPLGGDKKNKDQPEKQSGPKRTKMDIEIEKLEKSTRAQLDAINVRLNNGVASSGHEVQELVNSVVSTKGELVKLRETSSMLSNAGDTLDGVSGAAATQTTFAINKYPHLKYAINARRNLQKCFRELAFFSEIPVKCADLKDELQQAEWSEDEMMVIRDVCKEHVQLDIFLKEAEAGMKRQQEADEDDDDDDEKRRRRASVGGGFKRTGFDVGLPHNNDEVDRFLKDHVQIVLELGEEIRQKIRYGIGTSFDLAFNNPANMVALVEGVEIYETANREYQAVHGGAVGFTGMRALALAELYEDMEARCMEVFDNLADTIDETDTDDEHLNKLFTAILRGANELSAEITFVSESMASCFPSFWAVDIIWSSCVAHLCSEQILTNMGGIEGENLPNLGMPQLLDLVAWVENFFEVIEENFPDLDIPTATEPRKFKSKPTLLSEDHTNIEIQQAIDSLAWASNILWDAHGLGMEEFLFRTEKQAVELLERFYKADHEKLKRSDGLLWTSLCGDVYGFIGLQVKTIRERLTRKSEAMIKLVAIIFKGLYDAQKASRDHFLNDFDSCCAGSNDFMDMSEKCEDIITDIRNECILSPKAEQTLELRAGFLLGLYCSDAVYAAQKISYFVFQDIYESEDITSILFTVEWLDEMPDNDVAVQVKITMGDYMADVLEYLDDIMIQKALEALVTKCVLYYIEELLLRASTHKSGRDSFFVDNRRALERMEGDVRVFKEYFEEFDEDFPTLRKTVETEFDFFETIQEIISIAGGCSDEDIRDYIYAFQNRVKNYDITYAIVGDLYHLVNPSEEKQVYEVIKSMEDDLKESNNNSTEDAATIHARVPGLHLETMLKNTITNSARKRPGEGKGLFSWG